jgi:hypothetical protein
MDIGRNGVTERIATKYNSGMKQTAIVMNYANNGVAMRFASASFTTMVCINEERFFFLLLHVFFFYYYSLLLFLLPELLHELLSI